MQACKWTVAACLFALLTLPAGAQLGGGIEALFDPSAGCGNAIVQQGEAVVADAPLVFYAVPDDLLSADSNRVEIRVSVDGAAYLVDGFHLANGELQAIEEGRSERQRSEHPQALRPPTANAGASGFKVFELLAERAETRAELHRLAGEATIELEVSVNGVVAVRQSWSELAENSRRTLESHGLPVAIAESTKPSSDASPGPRSLEGCGDGYCDTEENVDGGEDCESCPEDCGGPCAICGNGFCGPTEGCSNCSLDCGPCTTCPEDLGTEERTEYLYSTSLGWECGDAWTSKMYYDYQENHFKRYRVRRTRQCDGTITESVVPGSTYYFSNYCWRPTYVSCSWSYGYPYPIC